MDTKKVFVAHVKQNDNGGWDEHLLVDHAQDVAKLASKFATIFGNGDWATAAAFLHDLGKEGLRK